MNAVGMAPASGSGLGLGSGLRDGPELIEVVALTLVLGVGPEGAGGSSAHPTVAIAMVNVPAQMRIVRMLSAFRATPAEHHA
jgi:hypothetical protein